MTDNKTEIRTSLIKTYNSIARERTEKATKRHNAIVSKRDAKKKRVRIERMDALFDGIANATRLPTELSLISRSLIRCELYDPIHDFLNDLFESDMTICNLIREFADLRYDEFHPCDQEATMYSKEKKAWICDYHGKITFSHDNPKRPLDVNMFNWAYCHHCNGIRATQNTSDVPAPVASERCLHFSTIGWKCENCFVNLCARHHHVCVNCPYTIVRRLHSSRLLGFYCVRCMHFDAMGGEMCLQCYLK